VAYSIQADILEQLDEQTLIELTDDANEGEIDTDAVTRSIADADAEMDGYLGARYSVPLSPVPTIARKLSVDISIYNLYARRRGAPEDRRQRYVDAIAFLKEVAAGRASLGESDGAPADTHRPEFLSSTRVFSRGNMSGW